MERMGLKIQYIPVPGGAVVLSCEGSGSAVTLPEKVDGLVLREIGAYAFSSPHDAMEHVPAGTKTRTAQVGNPALLGDEPMFLGGSFLREIVLPSGIQSIGEYAFYNCSSLTRISLSAGAARVGNGAFMNCGRLNEICCNAHPEEPTALRGLLTEIQREVRVTFVFGKDKSVWVFPEYFEESIENGPARIFEHFIHGAGYRYRQCFQTGQLDADAYDRQFPTAIHEAEQLTLLRIALVRLRYPYQLLKSAKQQYLDYLKANAAAAAELLIKDDDPDGLSFIAANGVLTKQAISAAVDAASKFGRAECLSILLNERHTRFPAKERSFDL